MAQVLYRIETRHHMVNSKTARPQSRYEVDISKTAQREVIKGGFHRYSTQPISKHFLEKNGWDSY